MTTPLFAILVGLNVALLVASNAAGAKMIALPLGLSASATVLPYILSFVVTDLINEYFGKSGAKLAVHIGFGTVVVSAVLFSLALHAPPAVGWHGQEAFQAVFGLSPRILLGGWLAYLASQYLDVFIFQRIRAITGESKFWLRKNGSTLVSQFIDSIVFISVAFYGVFPLVDAILGQYLIKVAIVLLETPLSYLALTATRRFVEPASSAITSSSSGFADARR
ncbi:MAG: hypothetical protein RL518_2263 [Pseudomonadota bacterium]